MEQIKNFLSFIEIRTKTASYIPVLTGLGYVFYLYHTINLKSMVIFIFAMILFDMAVTAINNYMDTREAGVKGHFSRPVMLIMIYCMCIPSAFMGLYLTYIHGLAVLFFGAVCFIAGIGYTYGPAPISKSPYGEVVSGLIQGFCLPFLTVLICSPVNEFIYYNIEIPFVDLRFDFIALIKFAFMCAPLILCIANIMLANNTCDIEADKATRYTLPRHIGRKNAVNLLTAIYFSVYVSIIIAFVIGAIPVVCLLTLPTIFIVWKNTVQFRKNPIKPDTFSLVIFNFFIITIPYAIFIWIGALLGLIL